jgi:hypothetical protein
MLGLTKITNQLTSFWQIRDSFFSVSLPILTRNNAFFCIFRELSDSDSFVPLRAQKISKLSPLLYTYLLVEEKSSAACWKKISKFCIFVANLTNFCRNFADHRENAAACRKFKENDGNFGQELDFGQLLVSWLVKNRN